MCEICLSALTDREESKFLEKLGRTSNMAHHNTLGGPAGPIKELVQKYHQRAGLVPCDTIRYDTVQYEMRQNDLRLEKIIRHDTIRYDTI